MARETVLVVGASRGIGAELVRQYLTEGDSVHATVRQVAQPGKLNTLTGDLTVHELDVRDVARSAELAAELGRVGFDIAIHSAGIYRGHTREELMEVNAVAPIRFVQDLLNAGALRRGATVVIMTSQMGARLGTSRSLGDYGDSKAELNDEFRRRSEAWAQEHDVIAVVVHPGWVRTDMGGTSASLSVEESVAGIRRLISNLGADAHGRFWTWDGRVHPW